MNFEIPNFSENYPQEKNEEVVLFVNRKIGWLIDFLADEAHIVPIYNIQDWKKIGRADHS